MASVPVDASPTSLPSSGRVVSVPTGAGETAQKHKVVQLQAISIPSCFGRGPKMAATIGVAFLGFLALLAATVGKRLGLDLSDHAYVLYGAFGIAALIVFIASIYLYKTRPITSEELAAAGFTPASLSEARLAAISEEALISLLQHPQAVHLSALQKDALETAYPGVLALWALPTSELTSEVGDLVAEVRSYAPNPDGVNIKNEIETLRARIASTTLNIHLLQRQIGEELFLPFYFRAILSDLEDASKILDKKGAPKSKTTTELADGLENASKILDETELTGEALKSKTTAELAALSESVRIRVLTTGQLQEGLRVEQLQALRQVSASGFIAQPVRDIQNSIKKLAGQLRAATITQDETRRRIVEIQNSLGVDIRSNYAPDELVCKQALDKMAEILDPDTVLEDAAAVVGSWGVAIDELCGWGFVPWEKAPRVNDKHENIPGEPPPKAWKAVNSAFPSPWGLFEEGIFNKAGVEAWCKKPNNQARYNVEQIRNM